jgi:hypothetical protein
METLASVSAAAEPLAASGRGKGGSSAAEDGSGKRDGPAGGLGEQDKSHGHAEATGDVQAAGHLAAPAEVEAVATLAAGAAGPARKRGEQPANAFLLQRAVDTSEVSAAEATAVAALAQNGRDSARKRARQLNFGTNSPSGTSISAVSAQAYPVKGHANEDDDAPLSPSSAAGTLLGFAGAAAQQAPWYGDGGGPSTPSRRKACNCKNSKCLKLYCECFASGSYCSVSCNCQGCQNNEHYQAQRKSAIDATLERNPMAFRPKIAATAMNAMEQSPLGAHGRHTKGCHCKKSGCLKKYCECFQAGVLCSAQCKCHDCKNTEESVERKALLTNSAWDATPHSSKERNATPSPVHARRWQPSPPPGSRGVLLRRAAAHDAGLLSMLDPAIEGLPPNLMLPRMGAGAGQGPAIALQVQETMMNMRLAHKSTSAGSQLTSSVVGLPQERESKLAERTALRNHLSDPMLFNLCRVLLLSAKKAGDGGTEDTPLQQGASSSSRVHVPPALAPPSDTRASKKRKIVKADAGGGEGAAAGQGAERPAEGAQAHQDTPDDVNGMSPVQRMQRAVLLEMRHYLGQVQAVIQARPSSEGEDGRSSRANGKGGEQKNVAP